MTQKEEKNELRFPSSIGFSGQSRVEIQKGKKVVKFEIPKEFQGHTFALDLVSPEDDEIPEGPFQFEYFLFTEFSLHQNDLSSVDVETGFSYLRISEKLSKLKRILIHYSSSKDEPQREAELKIISKNGIVQRLSLLLPEHELTKAVNISGEIISAVLDSISFRKQVPLQVRHIEVKNIAKKFYRRYQTLPYSIVELQEEDISESTKIPKRLVPLLRLFREAVNSSKPHYRLLCLYRIREGLQKIQSDNNAALREKGLDPQRPVRRIPNNEMTRNYFSDLIGKKLSAFLEHVRKNYRIPIAHIELNEYEHMLLDPANVRTDHRIDHTNAILMVVQRQMIQDEWDLMKRYDFLKIN